MFAKDLILQYHEYIMIEQSEVKKQPSHVLLEIKTSRTSEETPEAMKQFLLSLVNLRKTVIPGFWFHNIPFSFEIAVIDQLIYFYLYVGTEYQGFFESQLVSQYPKALITRVQDYMPAVLEKQETLAYGQMKFSSNYLFPLRTYADFKDVDPLSSLLGVLSKAQAGDIMSVQFMLVPVGSWWQRSGERTAGGSVDKVTGKATANPHAKEILLKVAESGFQTAIRIAINSNDKFRSEHLLTQISQSFAPYSTPINGLILKKPYFWQKKKLLTAIKNRWNIFMPRYQMMNVSELASLYHFPGLKLANIHNIAWHKVILSDPPDNLTVADNLPEEEKNDVNFFAKTEYKNKMTVFGIKKNDRRRHVYVIGKTGSGKSTLIANMAINDMRNNRGFCIIDPHGDLCEVVLDYVPSFRINDVIYLDPSNTERAVAINPLEVMDEGQRELTVSGIVAIFNKLYGNSWGPRLEYILRNTLLSVVTMPNATMLMVPEMLGNDRFRAKVVDRITDPVLKSFWLNEFNMYSDKMRTEAVSPIQNKVGQFLSSTVIRNILKNPKSTLDLRKCMDEGKIILLNLSQGRLGEDNAALLGAMIITKIQLAAMSRVNIPEPDRKDFYLYVDEFQNFATSSFIKILSEARKYRLNLILANQYIAQIEEDVRAAIFGNAGTLMSFLVGATDAAYLAKEYKERFTEEDLLALGNYRAIVKLAIDNITMPPFLCYSLPLPRSVTQAREKVLRNSMERYTKPIKEMTLAGKMNDEGVFVEPGDEESPTPDAPTPAPAAAPPAPKVHAGPATPQPKANPPKKTEPAPVVKPAAPQTAPPTVQPKPAVPPQPQNVPAAPNVHGPAQTEAPKDVKPQTDNAPVQPPPVVSQPPHPTQAPRVAPPVSAPQLPKQPAQHQQRPQPNQPQPAASQSHQKPQQRPAGPQPGQQNQHQPRNNQPVRQDARPNNAQPKHTGNPRTNDGQPQQPPRHVQPAVERPQQPKPVAKLPQEGEFILKPGQ